MSTPGRPQGGYRRALPDVTSSSGLRHRAVCTRLIAWCAAAFALVACTTRMDVRSLVHGGGQTVYELRGHDLAALHSEARRLCPGGVEVLREWQRTQPAEAPSGLVRRWTIDLVESSPLGEAQMQVVCRT